MAIRQDPLDYERDKYTGAQVIAVYEHHKIHEGEHYIVASYSQLNVGASLLFGVQTANEEEEVHMTFGFVSTGQTTFEIWEGCTYDTSSSVVTPVNSNRNSSNLSSASVQKSASVTSWGTKIYEQKIGIADNPVKSIGGDHRASDEMPLRVNTKYIYRFLSTSASNIISYRGIWYHEKPKES